MQTGRMKLLRASQRSVLLLKQRTNERRKPESAFVSLKISLELIISLF
uniref:Oxidoreductase NAD-binding domain-containing protein 1-like n=1 Tax=Phallusia mammillata TaxID=59560 RepID=A0A6F9DNK0_9ASCI|nr:oxidoreductase NAD-binding domain-containing protein 1-like [Phallusia mammillata]